MTHLVYGCDLDRFSDEEGIGTYIASGYSDWKKELLIRELEEHSKNLTEMDAEILRLLQLKKSQCVIARRVKKSQAAVSKRQKKIVKYLQYWIELVEVQDFLLGVLKDLKVEEREKRAFVEYLYGKSQKDIQKCFSSSKGGTICQGSVAGWVKKVQGALESGGKKDPRKIRVLELSRMRSRLRRL